PNDDVDLFLIADFAYNRINACTVAADESSDRIDTRHGAGYSNLGTDTGFTGNSLDLNRAAVHFGHLCPEQPLYKFRTAAADNQLRTAVTALDIFQVNFEPLARIVAFALNLFAPGHDRGCLAQFHADNVAFNP